MLRSFTIVRSYTFTARLVLGLALLTIPTLSQARRQTHDHLFKDDPKGQPVALVVFNQTDHPVHIRLLLDGSVLYDDTVKVATYMPAIVVSKTYRIRAGHHHIEFQDLTRTYKNRKPFEVKAKTHFEVWLNPNGSGLDISYGDRGYA